MRGIAGDEEDGLAIRSGQHRVDAVIAAAFHGAQLFDGVELVVVVRGSYAVEAAVVGILVVVHAHPERIKSPKQAVGGLDRRGDTLDRCGIQGLPRRRRREPVERAVLVAHDEAVLVIHAHGHPRALLLDRHGVEQLDLEVLHDLDPLGRRGLVFIHPLPGIGVVGSGLARAGLRRVRGLGVGQAREAQRGEKDQEECGDFHEESGERFRGGNA